MTLVLLRLIVFVIMSEVVVLSVLIDVGGCGRFMSCNVLRIETTFVAFKNNPLNASSATEDITALIRVERQ